MDVLGEVGILGVGIPEGYPTYPMMHTIHLLPTQQNPESQTLVKTLPSFNFIGGRKK